MYKVSIDRIALVMSTDKEMHAHFLSVMYGFTGEKGYKQWKKKYTTHGVIPLCEDQTLRICAGVSHKATYVTFGFNPAALGAEQWEQMHIHCQYLFEFGYATLLKNARVTYLEIAVDCKGIPINGLLPFDEKLRNSMWYPSYDAPAPTGYVGRRGSKRVMKIYDRGARLTALGKPAPDVPTLRIEAVLRQLSCSVAGLKDLSNPFTSFGVASLENAMELSQEGPWQEFLQRSCKLGTAEALGLAGPMKKSFMERLKQSSVAWWDAHAAWTMYPHALQALDVMT